MVTPYDSSSAYMSIDNLCIAVSGSEGFVGSHLVRRLNELGVKVIEIKNDKNLDILNFEQLNRIDSFDVFVHLAAKTFVPESYENPREFYFTNSIGTLNGLELCRIRKARFIYASSYVYGIPNYLPIDESHPVRGFNPYSASKILGEQMCEGYNRDHGLKVTIIRPFNIYGPNQDKRFLIPGMLHQAKNGKVILMDSAPKRDFIYIDDVVEAYIKAIQFDSGALEIFNLGSGKSFSVGQVLNEILKHFSNDVEVLIAGEERACEIPDTVANIGRAKELLGWNPVLSLFDGIKICVDAVKYPSGV